MLPGIIKRYVRGAMTTKVKRKTRAGRKKFVKLYAIRCPNCSEILVVKNENDNSKCHCGNVSIIRGSKNTMVFGQLGMPNIEKFNWYERQEE